MHPLLHFPTALHQQVAELVRDLFITQPGVDTMLVVNSCARGQATPQSDLDLAILLAPTTTSAQTQHLENRWHELVSTDPVIQQFQGSGRFAHVHLDFFDGEFVPPVWDDGGGPDAFEIEIGNRIAYSAPLHEIGSYFRELQTRWLPYYAEELRHQRLVMVRKACLYDLEHVPFFVDRALYFQAFDRFYKAFQEFLQALCIARRTYPVAYNKWIHELVALRLGLPELYPALPPLLSMRQLDSPELNQKADALRDLLEKWTAL